MFQLKHWLAICGTTATLSVAAVAHAGVVLSEGFEGPGLPANWVNINNTTAINSATVSKGVSPWGKGNTTVFSAQAGTSGSYFADDYRAAPDNGSSYTISDWLLTPTIVLNNGFTFSFWARSDGSPDFPDTLQVRVSGSGASTNVGTSSTSVGAFTTLLTAINSSSQPGGFPTAWTQYTGTISGLTGLTTGRLAFRYFIPDTNLGGDYIGIDSVTVLPEPETIAILALGLGAMSLSLRRKPRQTYAATWSPC